VKFGILTPGCIPIRLRDGTQIMKVCIKKWRSTHHKFDMPSSQEKERHGSGTKYAFSMLLSNFAWKLLAATPPALCWAYINPW